MQPTPRLIKASVWLLTGLVASLAFISWGQGFNWRFSQLSVYQIFPIFGLLAFSFIWVMYVAGFLLRHLKIESDALSAYFKIMSVLVLATILLHPGLLWWQLWNDGLGLPPGSYLQHYVAPGLKWAVIVSSVAWLIFLAYEFRYKYKVRRWWKYFEYTADAAIVGLFFHSLFLGTNLHQGWLRIIWFFYGAVLAGILIDLYSRKLKLRRQAI